MSAYIEYVKENYNEDNTLLEIGAGHRSTKAFAEHFAKMYSIEGNPAFENIYHQNYIHVDIESNGWYNVEQFADRLPEDYTFITFDGPAGGFDPPFIKNHDRPYRFGFCSLSWDTIKKDVDIIVDDTNRNWWEKDVVDFLINQGYHCEQIDGLFTVCKP